MAFAAYLLEKAILVTSRGRAFASLLKPRRVVFLSAARPQRGAFAAFQIKEEKEKSPTNAQRRKQDRHACN